VDDRVREVPARTKVATVLSALLIRFSCSSSEYCERCFKAIAASFSAVLLALTFRFLGILNSNEINIYSSNIPSTPSSWQCFLDCFSLRVTALEGRTAHNIAAVIFIPLQEHFEIESAHAVIVVPSKNLSKCAYCVRLLWKLFDAGDVVAGEADEDRFRGGLAVNPILDVVTLGVALADFVVRFAHGGDEFFAVHAN
jgi:hypothetical protein